MKLSKCILYIVVGVSHFLPLISWSQAVFAPTKGAEWNYYFISEKYDWNIPFFKPEEGITTIKYTKDTLISGYTFKKLEQSEKVKYKSNDTLFTYNLRPLFMFQRNDSVFVLNEDTISIAFVYKKVVGAVINLKSISGVIFSLEMRDTTSISPINQSSYKIKQYSYKSNSNTLDVQLKNPLILFDIVGPSNTDISVITTQGNFIGRSYRLICYKDSNIGELKFFNRDCTIVTSLVDYKFKANDFFVNFIDNSLIIKFLNYSVQVSSVSLYNIQGKLIQKYLLNNLSLETIIPLNFLQKGIYIISFNSGVGIYSTKKIFIN
jgi:hypothetical protein